MKMLYFSMVRFGNVNIDEFECVFSFMSIMRCCVLDILSSPSGTVFLWCCLLKTITE